VGVFGGIVSVLVLLNCFLFLGTQKTDLGGADLYIASFVGVALALTVVPTFRLAEAVVPLILTSGIITLPLTVQKEETMEGNPVESSSVKTEEKKEVSLFEAEGIPIDSIVGDYRINEKTVQLNFQLGPKGGVTKGAFKSFNGEVFINKDISKSLFSVELPFSKLTTFNKYRDESLAEEGYFNAAKFPLMSFASKKMIHKGAHYELEGNFTLLGVTKPLIVQLKYVGTSDVGNLPVLVGRSSIDRTQFGMKPDSKEGNIVDFEFRIELIR
jgi:polyisoprenoid-binding protein YceI